MIYLWEVPDCWPERLIGEYDRAKSIDRFALKQGEAISSEAGITIQFACKSDDLIKLDNLPNSALIPVVSCRLANLLSDQAPEDCQLVEVDIVSVDGHVDDYVAVVATKSVPVLDRYRSRFTLVPDTDEVMGIQELVCRKEGLQGLSIARDTQYLPNLFVSDELGTKIMRMKPNGMTLLSISDLC